jgi:uncharacterized protein Usg
MTTEPGAGKMAFDKDFEVRIARGYSLVTVNVLYWMPDHRHVLNEFTWQTLDLKPRYPRIEQFLDYWRREIDAVIREVRIAEGGEPLGPAGWRGASVWMLN